MTTREAPRWLVLVAFASIYLIWGSTYLAIRFAIETMPPLLMAGVRFVIAGGLLVAWQRAAGAPAPSRIEWRSATIIGAFLLLGGNGGVVWAEQFVESGLAALIVSTVPIWVVFLDWARPGGHRPPRAVLVGIAGGIVGMIILIGPAELAGASRVDLGGAIVLIGASLAWSTGSLYARSAPLPSRPLLATGMEMLAGGVLLLVAGSLAGEVGRVDPAAISAKSVAALAYLIGFGALVGFTAYVWLLRNVDTAKVATYAYVNPIVALVLGWWMAGEDLTARSLIAALVILAAVVLITTQGRFRRRPAANDELGVEARSKTRHRTERRLSA